MKLSFCPKAPLLLGPGPSPVDKSVLTSISQPTIGHLDEQCFIMMNDIKKMLQGLLQTKNSLTLPISGPGSAGMEACITNLIEPGEKIIVCVNGEFGKRISECASKIGASVINVFSNWGEPINPQQVEDVFEKNPDAKFLAFVHGETSTGVLNNAKELCDIGRNFNAINIVDAVTSLGGVEVKVDEWGIDAIFSGSQKCLSCPPGLSPLSFSNRALIKMRERKSPIPNWFLDLKMIGDYWENSSRAYHHTAPINPLYGLHQGLSNIYTEGLSNTILRHHTCHSLLKDGIKKLGLDTLVNNDFQLPQLTTIKIPAYIDDKQFRQNMLDKHSIEIGGGIGVLSGKVWRIGLMGNGARPENVDKLLKAMSQLINSSN